MKKVLRNISIIVFVLTLIAGIYFYETRDKHRQSYEIVSDTPASTSDETVETDDEKVNGEGDDEKTSEDEDDPKGEEGGAPHSGGESGHGPHGGYGGDGDNNGGGGYTDSNAPGAEPIPLYDYFMDGPYYICKGCYLPFPDIASLNAHECSYHGTEECVHEWEAEYNDVWVEATGHYEYGLISEGYDEAVYEERCVCKKCGEYFLSSEEAADHIIRVHGNEGSWSVESVIVSYIHHDPVYGDIFVIDEAAHWDRVIYRYRCRKCGEIKYPD